MPYPDLDYNLTDEQKAKRDRWREFGSQVMRPVGLELDKLADPADVIAEGSALWDVFKKYREEGHHARGFSKAFGGTLEDNMDPIAGMISTEEMGYWDSGLAVSLGVAGMPFAFCQMSSEPVLQQLARDYVADSECEMIGCWGITEPNHGGDWGLAGDNPAIQPDLQGELVGDEYILNGQKSAWVSNGTFATHSWLHIGLDPRYGMAGQGMAVCPLDLPGISRGKPLDKIGQRPLNQGEIFFEDVHLPKQYMVIDAEAYQAMRTAGTRAGGGQPPMASMAVMFAGMAKAALDEAIAYARNTIEGGKPIFEHKHISLKLFEMFMKVESARSLARRMYQFNAFSGGNSMSHVMAGKWMSTVTAYEVASDAIQIFGTAGASKQYNIEKLFRDARSSIIEDGVNESLALNVVDLL
jgi:alkylation response protein AidB-like acyl-CoA dehydrogenase